MKVATTLSRVIASFFLAACAVAAAAPREGYEPFALNSTIDQNPAKAIAILREYSKTHSMRPIDHFRLARAFLAKGDYSAALASWQAAQKMDGSGRFLSEPKRLGELGLEIQGHLNPVQVSQDSHLPEGSKSVASSIPVTSAGAVLPQALVIKLSSSASSPTLETASGTASNAELVAALATLSSPLRPTGVQPVGQVNTQDVTESIQPLEALPNSEHHEAIRNLGGLTRSTKHDARAQDDLAFAFEQASNGGTRFGEYLLALMSACITAGGLALFGLKIRARGIEAALHLPKPDEVLRACLAGAKQKSMFTVT